MMLMQPDENGFPQLSHSAGMQALESLRETQIKLAQDTKGYEARFVNDIRARYRAYNPMKTNDSLHPLSEEDIMDMGREKLQMELNPSTNPTFNKTGSGYTPYSTALTNLDKDIDAATNAKAHALQKGSVRKLPLVVTPTTPPPAGAFETSPTGIEWLKRHEAMKAAGVPPVEVRALKAAESAVGTIEKTITKPGQPFGGESNKEGEQP